MYDFCQFTYHVFSIGSFLHLSCCFAGLLQLTEGQLGLISGDALYALRSSLNASGNQLTDWNQNQVNPCTWSKVICDNNNNVVTV